MQNPSITAIFFSLLCQPYLRDSLPGSQTLFFRFFSRQHGYDTIWQDDKTMTGRQQGSHSFSEPSLSCPLAVCIGHSIGHSCTDLHITRSLTDRHPLLLITSHRSYALLMQPRHTMLHCCSLFAFTFCIGSFSWPESYPGQADLTRKLDADMVPGRSAPRVWERE